MYSEVQKLNRFFKLATKNEIDKLRENLILTTSQEKIFEMFYIKKQNRGFIADSLFVSESVISKELHIIRDKMQKVGKNLGIFR